MANRPNEILVKELKEYFDYKSYGSRKSFGREVGADLEKLLKACDFVYVTESGTTMHADRFCGSGYPSLVPFSQAITKGYNRICSKCAHKTYVERLAKSNGLL